MHLGIKNFLGSVKKYLFGDGSYSQNIVQGGSTLQPQASYEMADPTNLSQDGVFSWVGTQNGSYPAANIIDGNVTTQGEISAAAGNALVWRFSKPRNLRRFGSRLSAGTEGIYTGYIQYSDDGVNWSNTNHAGDVDCRTTSMVYYSVNDYGAHEWWRVYIPTARYIQSSHVEWNERITLESCIVVTGAATVAPDPTAGASAFTCQNLVIDGGSLAPSTNSKGLIGIVSGSVRLINSGRVHIDRLGKAGNFGNLTVLDLLPQSIKRKLKNSLAAYVVQGEGGLGGAAMQAFNDGRAGQAVSDGSMRTGGGGTGGANYVSTYGYTGRGGKGGPCCGGASSGGNEVDSGGQNAGDYGGPGGDGTSAQTNLSCAGGNGDPVGLGHYGSNGVGAGGGLLMLFTPAVTVSSGCIVSADGAPGVNGGNTYQTGSGGAGGGCVVIGNGVGAETFTNTDFTLGGADGTPGTQPTGTLISTPASGLSRTLMRGVDQYGPYIDVRFFGTNTSGASTYPSLQTHYGNCNLELGNTVIGASRLALIAGTHPPGACIQITETLPNGGFVTSSTSSISVLGATPMEFQIRRTATGATTKRSSMCAFSCSIANGVSVDFTYRVYMVSLKQVGYTNLGTVRASGGAASSGCSHKNGGAGGAGSVNTFTIN